MPGCTPPRVNSGQSSQNGTPLRLAAYTYSTSATHSALPFPLVPRVPRGMDAFFFVPLAHQLQHGDSRGQCSFARVGNNAHCVKAFRQARSLRIWDRRGWRIRNIHHVNSTAFVTSARLTSKFYKWVLPDELKSYDWVLSFDANYHVNLHGLEALVRQHRFHALVLMDWQHFFRERRVRYRRPHVMRAFGVDVAPTTGFDHFQTEASGMLDGSRWGYVGTSFDNCALWLEEMRRLVLTPAAKEHGQLFGTYYDTSTLLHHLSHPSWPSMRRALHDVYRASHLIERDQFLLPFFLWRHRVLGITASLPLAKFTEHLCRCAIFKERFSVPALPANDTNLDGFACEAGLNFVGDCLEKPCRPAFASTRRVCQDMCRLYGTVCVAVVYNGKHKCYLKAATSPIAHDEKRTIGCWRTRLATNETNSSNVGGSVNTSTFFSRRRSIALVGPDLPKELVARIHWLKTGLL